MRETNVVEIVGRVLFMLGILLIDILPCSAVWFAAETSFP